MFKKLCAEALGAAFLLATVVGSGIMAERLASGNAGLALLSNTIATGAILFVLIVLFGPVSGAHFNPAVSMAMAVRRVLGRREAALYVAAQIAGGIFGVWVAHMMFDLPALEIGTTARSGAGQWFAEGIATFGLVLVVILAGKRSLEIVAAAVGLYITAAYWFTASTGFANPAVTIARSFTDSFSGIRPGDAPGFIVAQLAGAMVAVAAGRVFSKD